MTAEKKGLKYYLRDFVSYEHRDYQVKIGRTVASALTGFIIGATVSHIIWLTAVKQVFGNLPF